MRFGQMSWAASSIYAIYPDRGRHEDKLPLDAYYRIVDYAIITAVVAVIIVVVRDAGRGGLIF